jgi:hypothetical protein
MADGQIWPSYDLADGHEAHITDRNGIGPIVSPPRLHTHCLLLKNSLFVRITWIADDSVADKETGGFVSDRKPRWTGIVKRF